METVLLSIHLIVAIALVAVILLQRSEGGALGIGGGGQGGMMTARGAGNLLTKATKWLAIVFLANSLLLGWFAANKRGEDAVLDAAVEQSLEEGDSQLPEIPTVPEDGEG
ncbi:preprotein translocase subunit SecG [Kordiimonas sp.]|uniref:preprotein translocase subunit SecG n=1 Tax=Kordiimonas sp. TaxID=1970157 RepID=UPI003A914C40